MAKIKYLVVSDLHLGAANSVLTSLTPDLRGTQPHVPSELLKQFVACLRTLIAASESEGVRLILNGDVMELALSGTNDASMCFEGFMRALMAEPAPAKLSERILLLPGNHDHHLWNTARETQYITKYLAQAPPDEYLAPERSVSRMFDDGQLDSVPISLLNTLIQRLPGLGQMKFDAVYPNFAELNADRTRGVVFHHGHYVEPIYSLMTTLKEELFPDRDSTPDIAELEAENGAWIDFFWSALGRSGQVGADIELIYDKLQDPHKLAELIDNLAHALLPKGHLSNEVKRPILRTVLAGVVGMASQREPHKTDQVLSEKAKEGLVRYMERYLLPELQRGDNGTLPPDLAFVFGHTHKPFESKQRFSGYPGETRLFNSGGWVVDTLEPDPIHGASVIVVDEELNVATIRMYRQCLTPEEYRVAVPELPDANPLVAQLREIVRAEEEPWAGFSKLATLAVADHRQNLRIKVSY